MMKVDAEVSFFIFRPRYFLFRLSEMYEGS